MRRMALCRQLNNGTGHQTKWKPEKKQMKNSLTGVVEKLTKHPMDLILLSSTLGIP